MKPHGVLLVLCVLALPFVGCSRSEEASRPTERPHAPSTPAPATAPTTLAGSSWLVETVGGRGVLDNSRLFIRFDPENRATGATGINTFSGTAVISGESIKIGPLAATRRAGPEALMDQEHQFLTALESATSWQIDDAGRLGLRNAAGDTVMRLSPMPPDAPDKSGSPASGK